MEYSISFIFREVPHIILDRKGLRVKFAGRVSVPSLFRLKSPSRFESSLGPVGNVPDHCTLILGRAISDVSTVVVIKFFRPSLALCSLTLPIATSTAIHIGLGPYEALSNLLPTLSLARWLSNP